MDQPFLPAAHRGLLGLLRVRLFALARIFACRARPAWLSYFASTSRHGSPALLGRHLPSHGRGGIRIKGALCNEAQYAVRVRSNRGEKHRVGRCVRGRTVG